MLVVEGAGSVSGGEMNHIRGVDGDTAAEIVGVEGPKQMTAV